MENLSLTCPIYMLAPIHQEYGRTTYQSILDEIVGDTSITENAKEELIKHVLSGRWFSKGLDTFFHNN